MAIQLINIGNVANDGTGDDLREAMIKINQNFEELDLRDDEQTTASNLGFGSYGIFKDKLNYDLRFKGLTAGTDVTISEGEESLTINADGGIKTISIASDVNAVDLADNAIVGIKGGSNIDTTIIDGELRVSYTGPEEVEDDLTPNLGGNLIGNNFNIQNCDTIQANNFYGNFNGDLNGTVYGIDVRSINLTEFDFGSSFSPNIVSSLDWFMYNNDVDFGSFNTPTPIDSDFGTIIT